MIGKKNLKSIGSILVGIVIVYFLFSAGCFSCNKNKTVNEAVNVTKQTATAVKKKAEEIFSPSQPCPPTTVTPAPVVTTKPQKAKINRRNRTNILSIDDVMKRARKTSSGWVTVTTTTVTTTKHYYKK